MKYLTPGALVIAFLVQTNPNSASAITLNTTSLPTEIQSCIGDGQCIFGPRNLTSIAEHQGADLFTYQELSSGSLISKFLVRYTLSDAYQVSYDVVMPSAGYIWLGGNTQYNQASQTHDFSLYLDQVSPLPLDLTNFSSSHGNTIHLGLSSNDLLAGGAHWSVYADETNGFTVYESGSLVTDGVTSDASLCLAGGCGADATFNTVFLQFLANGTTLDLVPILNTTDSRAILYQQRRYYDDGSEFWADYQEQVHSVQTVPLPAAVWLFASGLLGLIGSMVRRPQTETQP